MNQTAASWPAAQRLPPCSLSPTQEGTQKEGRHLARRPHSGYFCQIIEYEDGPLFCPSWAGASKVRHSPHGSLTPREQLLQAQPSKAASLLPDRSSAGECRVKMRLGVDSLQTVLGLGSFWCPVLLFSWLSHTLFFHPHPPSQAAPMLALRTRSFTHRARVPGPCQALSLALSCLDTSVLYL